MNRRVSCALTVVGVICATVAAAFATNAAFSLSTDSIAVAAVSGIGTVPEVAAPSSRGTRSDLADAADEASDHTYSVRDAGKVVLRQRLASLMVVEAIANPGWVSASVKSETRLGVPVVEVRFVNRTNEVVFTALLIDNSIIARDEVRNESSLAGDGGDDENSTTTPGTGTHNHGSTTTTRSDPPSTDTTEPTEATEPTETTDSGGHDGPEPTDAPELPEPTDPPETDN